MTKDNKPALVPCTILRDYWDKNGVLPWHPGAAKWFAENAGAEISADMIYSN